MPISYLRLVLVLALVFLHYGGVSGSQLSPYRGFVGQDLPVASIVISFMLYIGFTAVPAMSAISGYLFFNGASPRVPPQFATKLRRRAVSLALPFVLWSSFFAVVAYLVHLQVPSLFAGDFSTSERSIARVIADAVFSYSRTPMAFQLWFVHDLILDRARQPSDLGTDGSPSMDHDCGPRAAVDLLDFDLWIFNRLDVLLFFCFGAGCAMHGFRPDLPKPAIVPVFMLFLLAAMTRTLAPYYLGHDTGLDLDIGTAAMRVLGALAVWNAASLVLTGAFAKVGAPELLYGVLRPLRALSADPVSQDRPRHLHRKGQRDWTDHPLLRYRVRNDWVAGRSWERTAKVGAGVLSNH